MNRKRCGDCTCGAADGLALQTSYEKLDQSLPPDVFLGCITYTDYQVGTMDPTDNLFTPFMYKRPAFAHEREIRAVIWTLGDPTKNPSAPPQGARVGTLPWNAADVLDHVYVNPYAEDSYTRS